VRATEKNNRCLETTAVVHQAQNSATKPSQAPCKVSMWEMEPTWARDQNAGLQSNAKVCDSSHCLSVPDKKVPAVTSIPLSRLYPGAPHGSPCRGDPTLYTDTLMCALALALTGPSADTSRAWHTVGRTVHTQLAGGQLGTPWHEQSNPVLPHGRELESNRQFLLLH